MRVCAYTCAGECEGRLEVPEPHLCIFDLVRSLGGDYKWYACCPESMNSATTQRDKHNNNNGNERRALG